MDAMSSPITGMPTELIAACLSRLDNLRWFSSALISHRLFHTAYTEQPSIVIEILKKQIPSALLPFALAVHNSAQRPDHDQGFVSEVLDELYLHAGSAPVVLSKIIRANLSDAVRISQMHSIVQVYCEKFGAAAFEDLVGLCGDHLNHESVVLSSGESFRIMRAFYRAEIFWRLFARGIHDFEPLVSNIQNGFFDRHSPWVNEQLACVHDFLERELSESYNEVAAHDVEWGKLSIEWLSFGENDWRKQYLLAHGLRFISELNSLETYDERRNLLSSKFGVAFTMLPEELIHASPNDSPGILLKTYTHQALEDLTRPDDIDHLESGPFHTWFWAHEEADSELELLVMSTGKHYLRQCGYVMWDQRRAQGLKKELVGAQVLGDTFLLDSGEKSAEMMKSFHKRSLIWQKGGRGYWVDGDWTGIDWPEGDPSTT